MYSVPRVTMKDGMRVHTSSSPLIKPRKAPVSRATAIEARPLMPAREMSRLSTNWLPMPKGINSTSPAGPLLAAMMNMSALKPSVEPTDRSNSPEIMSMVTPTAMMPCDAALVTMEAMERPSIICGGQPVSAQVAMMKNSRTDTKPKIAPDSGKRLHDSRPCSQ